MRKLIPALALSAATFATPVLADVGISISIGEPGFYGQLDLRDFGRPRLLYSQPVLVVPRYANRAPIYLRVPRDHSRQWSRYCGRYDACARPVYFVQDTWYRDVYAPRYRQLHAHQWRGERWDDRYDRRYDRRDYDRRDGRHGKRGRR